MKPRPIKQSLHQPSKAFLIIECLVYIGVFFILLGVGFAALYRCMENSVGLRRSANDISVAVHAGERWRADLRTATAPVRKEVQGQETWLYVPQTNGELLYRFADRALYRRVGSGPWSCVLTNIAASSVQPEPRENVVAWRWELELQHRERTSAIRPLFTFLSVPNQPKLP
jgi:hypothetical protein